MAPIIKLNGVGKIYRTPKGILQALINVNLNVEEGEFLCLLGPSGCGKSTLLYILAGLYEQSSGEVVVQGNGSEGRPVNALVFQEYAIFPWRTVRENVAFGLEMRGVDRSERYEIVDHYLAKVGLSEFVDSYPHQLSGGMKQRVALARALANNPEVLLMDEPFGALDAQTSAVLQGELLRIWEQEKKTVVYVTHSIEEAILLGDRVALMSARPGRVKAVHTVNLPRPRTLKARTTRAFYQLAQQLWEELIVEVDKSLDQETRKVGGDERNRL